MIQTERIIIIIGVEGALTLKKHAREHVKSIGFSGNALPEVRDLCPIPVEILEEIQPSQLLEAAPGKKVPYLKYQLSKALSFQILLNQNPSHHSRNNFL